VYLRPSCVYYCALTAALQGGAWHRLFWSALLHADEWHLYYNMSSLLWKGLQLETSLGSARFLLLLLELWASSSALLCAVYWAGTATQLKLFLPGLAAQYYSVCAVGFSGVLFGMKAVINANESGWSRVSIPFFGSINTPPQVLAADHLTNISMLTPAHSCCFTLAPAA
jgi:membrane associated rhomboid family serine protease